MPPISRFIQRRGADAQLGGGGEITHVGTEGSGGASPDVEITLFFRHRLQRILINGVFLLRGSRGVLLVG